MPEQLIFRFTPPTLVNISQALATFQDTVLAHEVVVESFYGYGKTQMKSLRCSPDGFVQLAIQLAVAKCFGPLSSFPTYEATQVRTFLHGRTETTRSASIESQAWIQAMLNITARDHQRHELLRRAIGAHVQYVKRASQGLGIDRHLFGLHMCLKEQEPVPEIFSDPNYRQTKHWKLSTSHLTQYVEWFEESF